MAYGIVCRIIFTKYDDHDDDSTSEDRISALDVIIIVLHVSCYHAGAEGMSDITASEYADRIIDLNIHIARIPQSTGDAVEDAKHADQSEDVLRQHLNPELETKRALH